MKVRTQGAALPERPTLNPEHSVCRFLAVVYCKACDWYAVANGPGLKALERIEAAYQKAHRHLIARWEAFRTLPAWLEGATPTDVEREIESGFLSSGDDVRLVYGCTRRRLWDWAESCRLKWVRSEKSVAVLTASLGASAAAQAGLPRANPIREE
jgi:hypothetical protein